MNCPRVPRDDLRDHHSTISGSLDQRILARRGVAPPVLRPGGGDPKTAPKKTRVTEERP
jgi:hypothetical protein